MLKMTPHQFVKRFMQSVQAFKIVCLICIINTCASFSDGNDVFSPCFKKQFTSGDSFICQCNSTYCDTIPSYMPLQSDQVTIFTSTKASDRFNKTIQKISIASSSNVTLTVNTSALYQSVLGFGGAMTDSAGLSIKNLSTAAQEKLIRSYYSADGIEYSLGRINIGTCDFSQRPYSLCEYEGDFNLTNFSLADEDINYKIPLLKVALNVSKHPLKFFATAWSPPKWMKDSGTYRYRGQLIGQPGGKYYKTLALYYAKFIQGYTKYGVPMWGITPQNEPFNGGIRDQPNACLWLTPEMERDYIKLDLGPTLEEQGLGHINIMMMDDQRFELPEWPVIIFGDPEAEKYVQGIAVHWYWDKSSPTLKLDETNAKFPDKFILYTEACQGTSEKPGVKVDLGRWSRGEAFSKSIIENMDHWVTGWVDWNMALNIEGGPSWIAHKLNAPIIVDAEFDVFYKQPMYYHLGHFSKFILPDSRRANLTTENLPDDVESIAFLRPDGVVAMVILNQQDAPVSVSVHDPKVGYMNVDVPARAIQTYLWNGSPTIKSKVYKTPSKRKEF